MRMVSRPPSSGGRGSRAGPKSDGQRPRRAISGSLPETGSPRHSPRTVTIEAWVDLMIVSDTLGKPILPYNDGHPSTAKVYYVHDGLVSYVYTSPSPPSRAAPRGNVAPRVVATGRVRSEDGRSSRVAADFPKPSAAVGPSRTRPSPGWNVAGRLLPSASETELLARTRSLIRNFQGRSLPPGALDNAVPHLRWALASIRAGELAVASHELALARQSLDPAIGR